MATLTKSVRTIRSDNAGYYTYKCDVTENSYNTANNTSNVTVIFSIKGPWSTAAFYEWDTHYGIIIDGSVKKIGNSSPYVASSYVQLLTWTGDVVHNSDGSKSISVSVYLHNGSSGYLPRQYTSSSPLSMGSVALTTIPRKSSISFGEFTMDSSGTITINRASSSFTHTITYSFGSKTGTITTKTTDTSVSWTPKVSELAGQIPTDTRGQGTLTVTTYSGSTDIGSNSYTFYCNLPASVVPTVGTITLTPQTYSSLIQNKNNVKVSVSGFSGGTGSSIKSYTFSGPGLSNTTTTNTSVTSGTISNTGTLTYKVTVTDNRGRTNSATKTISCYAWSAPSIIFDAYRVASSDSTVEDDSGTYIRCTYTIKYSYVNGTNGRKSFTISGGSSVSNITYNSWSKTQTTGVNGIVTETGSAVIKNCPITNTYNIYATITDNYNGNSNSTQITVFSAERIFNIRSNGNGIAFGKMADKNNVLDSKWPIRTDDTPQTMKNLTYKGSNLLSPTDDTMENWANMGNLATVYYNQTEKLNGQPAQYGYLLNLTAGPGSTQVHHIWAEQANGNLFHRGGNTNGLYDWKEIFDTSNYTDYVSSKPTDLYSTSTGNIGTITLTQSAADFTYLEIFYTDNNGKQPNSVKIYSPNGKYVSLSCIEPSTNGSDPRVYIRASGWTISGTSMTVGRSDLSGANRGVYGQMYPHANGTNIDVKVTENNYIKIFKVLGYK